MAVVQARRTYHDDDHEPARTRLLHAEGPLEHAEQRQGLCVDTADVHYQVEGKWKSSISTCSTVVGSYGPIEQELKCVWGSFSQGQNLRSAFSLVLVVLVRCSGRAGNIPVRMKIIKRQLTLLCAN